MTQEQKDHINAKISEALSGAFGGDWEERFSDEFPMLKHIDGNKIKRGDDYATGYSNGHIAGVGMGLNEGYRAAKKFISKEKSKVESEIKSALETIEWSFLDFSAGKNAIDPNEECECSHRFWEHQLTGDDNDNDIRPCEECACKDFRAEEIKEIKTLPS